MKRILAVFSLFAFACIPASAYTWPVSTYLNPLALPSNFTGVPGTGYSCTYAAYTGGGNNVVQTNYTSGGYTQSEYLWANGPVSGDTGPKGGYFQLNFSTYGLTLYANTTSGLTTIASSSASVGSGATVMMVTGPPTLVSSSYVIEVGVFVNGVNVIDLQNTPLYGTSETAFVPCSGQVNLANTYAAPTAPTGLGYSSATNYVDLSWTAATDPSGLGVWEYRIFRSDQTAAIGSTTSLTYSDTTVLPGTQYTYTVAAVNQFLSTTGANITARSVGISSNPPYPSATPEGRRVGVRPTGTYWGATGENIDVRSGNLNFAFPILTAIGRTGWSVPFNLVYNSQNWRKDSGGNWKFDGDIGYGFGWRLTAGTIIPVWSTGGITATYYLYVDSSGAEYRLSSNTGNVWSSPESVYVWFDANTNILHFRDGTYWYFGSTSAPGEADAGTLSPTMMSDTNANQISVLYFAGSGMTWSGYNNSSSRIGTITDVRAPSGSYTYSASPGYVTSNIGDGLNWTFTELTGQSLVEPFGGTSFGTTSFLSSVSTATGTTSFTYDSSGELTKVTLPKGGYLKYDYGTVAYSNGKSFREVTNRYLSKDGTVGSQTTYAFSHPTAAGADVESSTQINDPGGVGQKKWAFFTTGTYEGLTNNYYGNDLTAGATKTENDFTWAQDMSGNSYISSTTSKLDPGQTYAATKMTNQTVDVYGNVTQVQNYDYGSLSTPAKTYTYTYAYTTVTPYTSLYLYNRLAQATESDGTNTVTLATNVYDFGWCNSYPSYCKGNLYSTVTLSGTTTLGYDSYGNVNGTTVNGVTSSSTYPSSTNYAAPTQLTVGSLSQNMTYNTFLGLTTNTSPTGAVSSITYDTSARPATTTSPYGALTYYAYTTNTTTASIGSTSVPNTPPVTNGRYTTTTVDGLGRTITVITGSIVSGTSTPISQVDTVYNSCGCSPLGKMTQTSLPHTPGGTAIWTTYSYDGIGRTLSVLSPDGASTTSYVYQGNTVTVTDAATKWKTYTSDAFGRLTQVQEPNPAGGSNYVTTYTYDLLDHLIGVSMPRPSGTQTRTFNYGTLPTALLQSATNPENGTVNYTYDSQKRLSTITDAKSQRKVMTYDSLNRVTMVQRGSWSGSAFTEDTKQRTTYTYGTTGINAGLLTQAQYMAGKCAGATQTGTDQNGNPLYYNTNCALATESYGYTFNGAGQMRAKSLQITRNSSTSTTVTGTLSAYWSYDNEGRVLSVLYPSWNTCSTCTNQGSDYTYAYDTMGRLNTMTNALSSGSLVSGVTYGVANQVQQITSGNTAAVNSETRSYNSLFQLTQLTVASAINRQYAFPAAGSNNGKLLSQTDVLSGEIVAYTYDALNRLLTAQTTQVGGTQWGQSYTYDGFGNLTDQTVTAGAAPSMHVTYNPANNLQTAPVADIADANGNILSSATSPNVFDIDNRMTSPSGTTIKYSYDNVNKRIWRGDPSSGLDELDFWAGNQKLATYQISSNSSAVYFNLKSTNVYFGRKLVSKGTCSCTGAIVYTTSTSDALTLAPVAADRLGSIGKFYPYGQEKPSATTNDTEKFTGYFRDQATGLDYADQRYHQPGVGRFMSADPYKASAGPSDPGSWNRYAYTRGDPVNRVDRTGQDDEDPGYDDCLMLGCDPFSQPCAVDPLTGATQGDCGCSVDESSLANCGQAMQQPPPPPKAPVITVECDVDVLAQRIPIARGWGYHTVTQTTVTTTVNDVSISVIQTFEGINVPKSNPSNNGCIQLKQLALGGCWLDKRTTVGGGSTYNFPTQTLWSSGLSSDNCIGAAAILTNFGAYQDQRNTYSVSFPLFSPNSNGFTFTLLMLSGFSEAALVDVPAAALGKLTLIPGWYQFIPWF